MMISSRTTKTLALSLLVFSMPLAQAGITDMVSSTIGSVTSQTVSLSKKAALAAFIISVMYFLSREPENTPVRYNLDELKNGEYLLENIKFLILDGLIGHACKKPSLRVDESGKVIASKGAYPKGVYGHIATYAKSVAGALTFLIAYNKFKHDIANGLASWQSCSFSDFMSLPAAETQK